MTQLDQLSAKLASSDEAERIYAAEDIGFANCAEGIPPLLARLAVETSRAVREALGNALQNIESDEVIAGAIGLLASEDAFLRNEGVELLRQRGPRVIAFLQRAFLEADHDVRKLVLDVLAGMDGPGATEIYALALADEDLNVVITAVESLGNAHKIELRDRVIALAGSPNPMLRSVCLEALAQIGDGESLAQIRAIYAQQAMPDFLLPGYLKILAAHGNEDAFAEPATMLVNCHPHLWGPLLDTLAMLHRRHPAAPLPASLLTPLKTILQDSKSPLLRHQALRLLAGLQRGGRGMPSLSLHPAPDSGPPPAEGGS